MQKPFICSGIVGIAVIIMSLVLLRVFPSKADTLMEGFFTPIVAFEFVRTEQEVEALFGPSGLGARQSLRLAMDLGNRLDFGYMALYTLFLFLFARTCARVSGKPVYRLGMWLALLVLVGDVMENRQLLAITAQLENGGYQRELMLLWLFTWMKWGGLALIFLWLAPYFLKGRAFGRLIGVIGLATFGLAVTAFFYRSMANELMALGTALMFLLMIVYALTYRHRIRIAL